MCSAGPVGVERAALWLDGQLQSILTERDDAAKLMYTLGADGKTIAAHREATHDIEKIAARWNSAKHHLN